MESVEWFLFVKQKTAYEIRLSLVGSEMCIRDSLFPDRLAGWREAARVLKPGGLFATSVWRGPEKNSMARLQQQAVLPALPERLLDPPPSWEWGEIAEADGLMDEICSAAPFENATVSVLNATLVVSSPATLWRGMLGNPLAGRLLRACTPDELEEVKSSVLDAYGELAGGSDRPLLLDASCHVLVANRKME